MLLVGGLAWTIALAGAGQWPRVMLAVLYTYGWAMSRLDAYQHHYLCSLVLALLVFFPAVRSGDLRDSTRPRASAWAYVLLCATVAIVYMFAALAKTDAAWSSGAVLRRVTAASSWFQTVWTVLRPAVVPEGFAWAAAARALPLVQAFLALACLLAPWRDRRGAGPWRRWHVQRS
jgi:hypothetical protein